jgi:hypothetical protein
MRFIAKNLPADPGNPATLIFHVVNDPEPYESVITILILLALYAETIPSI